MKKLIFAIILVALMLCLPFASFAAESELDAPSEIPETSECEAITPEEKEEPAEGENSAPTATENIVKYIGKSHHGEEYNGSQNIKWLRFNNSF